MTIEPISPELDGVVAAIAEHHDNLTPLQRLAVATALELLSAAAQYATDARTAGGYATTDRGALAVHPGARHALALRAEAMRMLTAVLSQQTPASAAARAMNATRWGSR